jgi:PAS domain S-box-containing protein
MELRLWCPQSSPLDKKPTRSLEGKVHCPDVLIKDNLALAPRVANVSHREGNMERVDQSLLLSLIREALIVLDLNGIVGQWTGGAEKLFGLTAADMLGHRFVDCLRPEERESMQARLDRARGGQESTGDILEQRKDGSRIWLNTRISLLTDALGNPAHVVVVAQDRSEQRQARTALVEAEERYRVLERLFLQSQKMEAIGIMAAGIAHDFNNIMTVIQAASEAIRIPSGDNLGNEELNRFLLQEIQAAGERATSLTRQLLNFSTQHSPESKAIEINPLVQEMNRMLKRVLGSQITLETQLDPDLGLIHANANQIEQVLINLILNARDSMPSGGTLTIQTSKVYLEKSTAGSAGGNVYIQLAVKDTGCGMDEATRARLFEPFFTTKPEGKGSGLGMSTVQTIVTAAGGHLDVLTELGKGTTIQVRFPCLAEEVPATKAPANQVPLS